MYLDCINQAHAVLSARIFQIPSVHYDEGNDSDYFVVVVISVDAAKNKPNTSFSIIASTNNISFSFPNLLIRVYKVDTHYCFVFHFGSVVALLLFQSSPLYRIVR